jgi:16S rRNA (cytosine967-C5)-methyltransferase
MSNPRQLAFLALREIERRGAYTDIALDRVFQNTSLNAQDRGLTCELVYGIVRRQRTLDQLINQIGKKKAHQQPADLRLIIHLGLYQLRYLDQIPPSAAVNTTVELAKENGFKPLAGVVNGILRQYLRLSSQATDILQLPEDLNQKLGILYSFPDWLIEMWVNQFGIEETEQLCQWFNQPPALDLRVNLLKSSLEEVKSALEAQSLEVSTLSPLPQALRLTGKVGAIEKLAGFEEGWWVLQDSSAQLVSHLLDPQAGEIIIDACAAPGGKTTHIAELMGDQGVIWGCDRYASRLKKLTKNIERLQLKSIKILVGDSRELSQFKNSADRVLLDAPCSGLGTLHKRPDLRWKQTPSKIQELTQLQSELLQETANWVKTGGVLVYATCTLNHMENEAIIQTFLHKHPLWHIVSPSLSWMSKYATKEGWLKVLPHHHQMDGFFMVKLKKDN